MRDDVLVCEISGRRPGTVAQRPTEGLALGGYRRLVVSNDHEGYETDWEVVDVPDDYRAWYSENVRQSDRLWQAQMNRSYALELARRLGYRYCVQLDDNIGALEIAYQLPVADGVSMLYRTGSSEQRNGMAETFVDVLCAVLEGTDAGMAGCAMMGASVPEAALIRERYVYSFLALDVERCRWPFQGDFEDDIEYRLKLAQAGIPTLQAVPLRYCKTAARKNRDMTGCRQAYSDAGVERGEHMRRLYGDVYSCGSGWRNASTVGPSLDEPVFRHRLGRVKVGVWIRDAEGIERAFAEALQRHARREIPDLVVRRP